MHQCLVFNSVYFPKEREHATGNELHSDLNHVTIVQHVGGGVHIWFVNVYNL